MVYRPLASEAGRIHICAHRGHSAAVPENTMPALETAADLGATVAEIDVVLSRDGEIVLLHDEIIDRTTNGKGRARDYDLAGLKRLDAGSWFGPEFAGVAIPTLAEALAVARKRSLSLLIEIKEREKADEMIERLGRFLVEKKALEDVLVISFDHPSLLGVQKRFPDLRTEIITHARHVDPVGMAKRAGAASVSLEWNMFDPADAVALHAEGISVRVTLPRPEKMALRGSYGFDDERRLREYLAAGYVDVLAGDDVGYLVSAIARAS